MRDRTTTPDLAATLPAPPSSGPVLAARHAERDRQDRYASRGLLGEGGMAEVRLVEDLRIGREIAMKVPRRAIGVEADAFVDEARLQARLEHPSIVPVYEVGELGDTPYFTMKRVRGVTLDALLREEHPPRHRLLSAFCQVCLTVDYAHSRGVIHRDLKPSNVMLGDFGELYVLDWGIAKAQPPEDVVALGDHEASTAGGTLGYLAPERLRARPRPADARADVYALGAILFEILAGEPLNDLSSAHAAVRSTLAGADARASRRAPDREIPPELDDVCVRATALAPEDRFASARAMHDAVERFLEGDRDAERRRVAAQELAVDAARVAERALDGGTKDRAYALRAAGRALAFDATNPIARATLMKLLTEPPSDVPPEVQSEIDAVEAARRKRSVALAVSGYAVWPLFVALAASAGVHDRRLLIALCVILTATSAIGIRDARRAERLVTVPTSTIVVCMLASALLTVVAGSLVLVPLVVLLHVLAFVLLRAERARRVAIVVAGCVAIAAPMAVELLGSGSHAYAFHDGAMTTLPRMIELSGPSVVLLVGVLNVLLVAMAAAWVIRFRDQLTDAERRLHVQAWQLRQLAASADESHPPSSFG